MKEPSNALTPKPVFGQINAADALNLIQGDLEALPAEAKLAHLLQVCEAVGVNPLTKPFQYIRVYQDGKHRMILYATRDCADQLRKIHSINLTIASRDN